MCQPTLNERKKIKTRLSLLEVSLLLIAFAIGLAAYRLDKAVVVIAQQNASITKLNEENNRLQGIID